MKTCPQCKEEKELTEFHKDRNRKDGLYVYCKPCTNYITKKWRLDNPEKRKAIALKHDTWYRAANKDKIKEYNQKKYAEDSSSWDAASHRRRARLAQVETEDYTTSQILDLYGTDCHICGEPIDLEASRKSGTEGWERSLWLDHVVPIAKGGSDLIVNIRPSHGLCNRAKSDKLMEDSINDIIVEELEYCI